MLSLPPPSPLPGITKSKEEQGDVRWMVMRLETATNVRYSYVSSNLASYYLATFL